jgi:hypothetical protein
MPHADEVVAAPASSRDERVVVQSAIDPAMNEQLVLMLKYAIDGGIPLFITSLSRLSRNMDKLLYLMELLLSHGVPIVTTNYLIRPSDVWVRKGQLLQPDSFKPEIGLSDLSGLAGSHRKVVETVRAALAQ